MGDNYGCIVHESGANKTCIILHHVWKCRGHLSYQAKNDVVRRTMQKMGGGGSFVIPWGLKYAPGLIMITDCNTYTYDIKLNMG